MDCFIFCERNAIRHDHCVFASVVKEHSRRDQCFLSNPRELLCDHPCGSIAVSADHNVQITAGLLVLNLYIVTYQIYRKFYKKR